MPTFQNIPANLDVPGAFVETDYIANGIQQNDMRNLIFGQKLSTGTAESLKPYRITADGEVEKLTGVGSHLTSLVNAFRKINKSQELVILPLDDNSQGAASVGSIEFTAKATKVGILNFYIAGVRVSVGVNDSLEIADIAAKLKLAIDEMPELPVTATLSAAKVTLTTKHKGEWTNKINLDVNLTVGDITPEGLKFTIVDMQNGAGNPNLQDALDVLGDVQYHNIANPYTDKANMDLFDLHLLNLDLPKVRKEAIGYTAFIGNHGQNTTFADVLNSAYITCIAPGLIPNMETEALGLYMGHLASSRAIDPARGFEGLLLQGLKAPKAADQFDINQRDLLLKAGLSTCTNNFSSQVSIERAMTMKTKDNDGNKDTSQKTINIMMTAFAIASTWTKTSRQKFKNKKLREDGGITPAGTVTPSIYKAEMISLFDKLERLGWVQNSSEFIDNLTATIDPNDPCRLNSSMLFDTVKQLVVVANKNIIH